MDAQTQMLWFEKKTTVEDAHDIFVYYMLYLRKKITFMKCIPMFILSQSHTFLGTKHSIPTQCCFRCMWHVTAHPDQIVPCSETLDVDECERRVAAGVLEGVSRKVLSCLLTVLRSRQDLDEGSTLMSWFRV